MPLQKQDLLPARPAQQVPEAQVVAQVVAQEEVRVVAFRQVASLP